MLNFLSENFNFCRVKIHIMHYNFLKIYTTQQLEQQKQDLYYSILKVLGRHPRFTYYVLHKALFKGTITELNKCPATYINSCTYIYPTAASEAILTATDTPDAENQNTRDRSAIADGPLLKQTVLMTSVPLVFTHKASMPHQIVENPVSYQALQSILDLFSYTERVKLLCSYLFQHRVPSQKTNQSYNQDNFAAHHWTYCSAQPLTTTNPSTHAPQKPHQSL